MILLPDQPGPHPHEVLAAGKGGTIYVVDRDNMGHVGTSNDSQIVQSLINVFPTGGSYNTGNYSEPTYFNGSVYYAPVDGPVMAFTITNGLPVDLTDLAVDRRSSTARPARSRRAEGRPRSRPTGPATASCGRCRATVTVLPGTLHAYNPANLAQEYWNSDQAGTRDQLDPWLKFTHSAGRERPRLRRLPG